MLVQQQQHVESCVRLRRQKNDFFFGCHKFMQINVECGERNKHIHIKTPTLSSICIFAIKSKAISASTICFTFFFVSFLELRIELSIFVIISLRLQIYTNIREWKNRRELSNFLISFFVQRQRHRIGLIRRWSCVAVANSKAQQVFVFCLRPSCAQSEFTGLAINLFRTWHGQEY